MGRYTDVPADAWYGYDLDLLTELGLLGGFPDGSFRPGAHITRAEFASAQGRQTRALMAIQRWNSQRLRAQVAPAVVHIEVTRADGDAVGAGVIVHPRGVLATCYHVIADARLISCRWPDWQPGSTWWPNLRVLAEDPANDLALCQIIWPAMEQRQGFEWVRLAASPAEPAEPVVMLGSPAGIGGWESHGLVARSDIVAQLYKDKGMLRRICVAGAINPGNSGGPLIRASDGTLLGINSDKLVNVAIEGMAFAVPVADVRALMDRVGVTQ